MLPNRPPPLLLPSASSFLADAWAKSDFGLTLSEDHVLVSCSPQTRDELDAVYPGHREGWKGENILADLLAAEGAELGGAGAHDVV